MRLGSEDSLMLLFVALFVLLPGYVWCFWRKRRFLCAFAEDEVLGRINRSVSVGRQVLKGLLLLAAFVAIVFALCEPAWNGKPKKVKRRGRDIVVLLDVSKSMLAEDIRPNRLERARIAIGDLLDVLEGDRIALVTFAGNTTVKCPLTHNYAFMRLALSEVGTESTSKGGTKIGDAIRQAVDKVFGEGTEKYRDMILITDGEDHESFPAEAASVAGKEGIRIIAIGLGNEEEGTPIPVYENGIKKGFLEYEGEVVKSKLDAKMLSQVAYNSAGGAYLPVRTGTFELDSIYADLVASAQKRELESAEIIEYDEKFQVFLALGILLIICEMLTKEKQAEGRRQKAEVLDSASGRS